MINQWSETDLKDNGMSNSHDISIPNFQLASNILPREHVADAGVKIKLPIHKRDKSVQQHRRKESLE